MLHAARRGPRTHAPPAQGRVRPGWDPQPRPLVRGALGLGELSLLCFDGALRLVGERPLRKARKQTPIQLDGERRLARIAGLRCGFKQELLLRERRIGGRDGRTWASRSAMRLGIALLLTSVPASATARARRSRAPPRRAARSPFSREKYSRRCRPSSDFIRDTPEGREAETILRKCVHCGFCTATCPSYQVLGDDLDSPRGRIYLIKRALEGAPVTEKTRLHLDRCLTCRNCETTCPSGVRYGRLVDIGRAYVEKHTRRTPWDRLKRAVLAFGLPRRAYSRQRCVSDRPSVLRPRARAGAWPAARHARKMIVLGGCVQPRSRLRSTPPPRGAGPHRHFAPGSSRGRMLRGRALPPQLPGARSRRHARAHRCLVAARRRARCGSDHRNRERLRRDAQGPGHMLALDAGYRGKADRISRSRSIFAKQSGRRICPKGGAAAGWRSSRRARCSTASRSAAR